MKKEERAPERAAYSVNSFCKAHDFSRALFYRSLKEGWGPATMKCAGKTLVSVEAAAEWRRRMEERANEARANGDGNGAPVAEQTAAA